MRNYNYLYFNYFTTLTTALVFLFLFIIHNSPYDMSYSLTFVHEICLVYV